MTEPDRRTTWTELAIATAIAIGYALVVRAGPLSLPYFWDESDVYVPGAKWVAEHGLSVTPGVFPDDYSRGHPPLLYLWAAIFFALFGPSPTVGHLAALPFPIVTLVATYALARPRFGRAVAIASSALLASTPLFASIGAMLLPEMALAALGALSLWAFSRDKLWLAVLFGVLAVWVKETGIFVAAGVGAGVLADAWLQGKLWSRGALGRALLASLPLFTLGGFFVWQKAYAGYFVFPHHQNLFADRPFEPSNLATVFPSTLLWHGRWLLVGAALAGAILARRELRAELARGEPRSAAVLVACLSPLLFNAIFFSKMFWLERYALPAHPGLVVAACAVIAIASRKWLESARSRVLFVAAPVAAAVIMGLVSLRSATEPDAEEQTFAYADVIATHRAAFGALERVEGPILTTWPMTIELRHPYLGYVESPRETLHPEHVADDAHIGAILISAGSWRAEDLRRLARSRGMTRRSTHRVGVAPALEVWR
ncbi:MAG: glycosyltransferase family 39 protein [Sandaracinaceae bacterium]|nr:glycosyltransferase family 39 protein [Sandaracinaceae bacterium]